MNDRFGNFIQGSFANGCSASQDKYRNSRGKTGKASGLFKFPIALPMKIVFIITFFVDSFPSENYIKSRQINAYQLLAGRYFSERAQPGSGGINVFDTQSFISRELKKMKKGLAQNLTTTLIDVRVWNSQH